MPSTTGLVPVPKQRTRGNNEGLASRTKENDKGVTPALFHHSIFKQDQNKETCSVVRVQESKFRSSEYWMKMSCR